MNDPCGKNGWAFSSMDKVKEVERLCQGEKSLGKGGGDPLILSHHGGHGLLQPIEGQFEHWKDLSDVLDGGSIRPVFHQDRIDPNGMGKGLCDKLQPLIAGFPGSFLYIDGAIGGH
jgi:hypothetical protein